MIGIDTNILVRLITKDDEKQLDLVVRFLKETQRKKEKLFVSTGCVLEIIWVLESHYKYDRSNILYGLTALLSLKILEWEDRELIYSLLHKANKEQIDLGDLLLGLIARKHGCSHVATFDKKAARSPLFALLK